VSDAEHKQDPDDLVAGWIAEALSELEAGREVDVAALCRELPERQADVQAALDMRHGLLAMHQQERDPDGPSGQLLADRYRLLSAVGSGAAGTVWRAQDQRLEREVAIKLLHRELFAGGDSEARFHREAVVLAGHEHPHIVRIYDQGQTDDGTSYLVTELLRGASLHKVLERAQVAMADGPSLQRFSELGWLQDLLPRLQLESNWLRQAVRWVAELGEGLTAAHADQVCHRDVKPSNAFIRDSGEAVLLDFGIATQIGDASITRTNTVLGTPCYMAPEQAAGGGEPRPTLDIYGLTATLYHLLTLRPPHAGDLQQVLVALRYEDPVPAAQICRGLPRDLVAILDRGLERNPAQRYATIKDLVADLRAFLDHAPVVARPLGRATRTWRRIVRRPAKSLAISASGTAVALGAVAATLWLTMFAEAAKDEQQIRERNLPADICIEGWPDMRPLVPVEQQDALLGELTEILDFDDRQVGLRLLRAASFLDFGKLELARKDFEVIADVAGSDYMRELARRYANAKAGERGRGIVDLKDLPKPTTESDYFVAGFHALRNRDCQLADELLSEAEDYLPARDLRLLAIVGKRKKDPQRAITEASRLEGIYGYETARTQHTLAVAHLQLQLFEKAIPFCERSLELRPERHGPWTNLGFAHLRLGHLDEALRCYLHAVELRKWLPNSLSGLCQTYRELGRFDEAREVAMQIADDGWRSYELGALELTRSLAALAQDDRETQVAAARVAMDHFDAARDAKDSTNPKAGSIKGQKMLVSLLAANDRKTAITPLLHGMRGDPRNPRRIADLSLLLGEGPLDAGRRGRLRLWLLDLAVDLAPENPEYRRLRMELIKELRAGGKR